MVQRGRVSPQSRAIKSDCKIWKEINQFYIAFPQNDLSGLYSVVAPGHPSHLPAEGAPLHPGASVVSDGHGCPSAVHHSFTGHLLPRNPQPQIVLPGTAKSSCKHNLTSNRNQKVRHSLKPATKGKGWVMDLSSTTELLRSCLPFAIQLVPGRVVCNEALMHY